jgi:methionyl-tRNA formyltransferase
VKVVFAGTPEFAAESLRRLAAAPVEIAGVVTQPDRQRGRGRKVAASPVKEAAAALGATSFQPGDINSDEAVAWLRERRADALVVVAYGGILKRPAREAARLGAVNLHASLLPAWRGGAPVQRAMMAGDETTGVTVQRMEARLDTGPVLASAETPIEDGETAGELMARLAGLGAELLAEVVPDLEARLARAVPQDEARATHARLLSAAEGRIPWALPARRVCRHILAMNPWPKAWCCVGVEDDAHRVAVLRARVAAGRPGAVPGTVLAAGPDGLLVAAGEETVLLTRLQAPGRKPLAADAFLRGHPVAPGARLL